MVVVRKEAKPCWQAFFLLQPKISQKNYDKQKIQENYCTAKGSSFAFLSLQKKIISILLNSFGSKIQIIFLFRNAVKCWK